ncbi:bacteriocin-type transport-associated protein [Legionella massiliensis]|uniref:Bacteriocin-type transport-associated protein n=1 Tax=Legionella massiliensis TaxID=1034943 RepID=A0A078L5E4_9GAMM|nr:cyclic nucleotide-binding domain-containing protein [Legionella massiliensis]CDZ79148.1 bacteriocin-type transport-associated protein [Legionella massiliensis]CEE14886.1 Cyclic nucleotide-binding domain protein [Legionella massiliensis]
MSKRVIFVEGEMLTKEGEKNDNFYILIAGSVGLFKECDKKNINEHIGTLNSGETIGEMRVIKNRECSLTVTASENLTALQAPISLLAENAHLYEKFLESIVDIISNRLRETNYFTAKSSLEKKLKKRQLRLSILGIVVLFAFLFELGLGLYYVLNANEYICTKIDHSPPQFPLLKR